MVKKQVKVEWNFAPRPPVVPMITLWNAQIIARDATHEFRPEGIPTEKVWCFGCQEYFSSWHLVLWRHGMCRQQPGGKMPTIAAQPSPVATKKKKNDRVAMPKDFDTWSVGQMKSWIRKHRPENYDKIFGGAS